MNTKEQMPSGAPLVSPWKDASATSTEDAGNTSKVEGLGFRVWGLGLRV